MGPMAESKLNFLLKFFLGAGEMFQEAFEVLFPVI